jgi:hypothetical protein
VKWIPSSVLRSECCIAVTTWLTPTKPFASSVLFQRRVGMMFGKSSARLEQPSKGRATCVPRNKV